MPCEFDVAEGMTKRQYQKDELAERTLQLDQCKGLLRYMIMAPDHEAAESLARLRVGSAFEDEYRRIKDRFPPPREPREPRETTDGAAQTEDGDEDPMLTLQRSRLLNLMNTERTGGQPFYIGQAASTAENATTQQLAAPAPLPGAHAMTTAQPEAQAQWSYQPPPSIENADVPDVPMTLEESQALWEYQPPGGAGAWGEASGSGWPPEPQHFDNIDPQVLEQSNVRSSSSLSPPPQAGPSRPGGARGRYGFHHQQQ